MPYKNRDDLREYQKNWCARKRQKWIDAYGGECIECGSKEQLEFDHVDPSQKVTHRIWGWAEARIADELAKCQLLCRPCHQVKTKLDLTN